MAFAELAEARAEVASVSHTVGCRLVAHADWGPMPYERWYPDPESTGFCPPNGCWDVWLYVNNGTITEIVQMWIG